MTLQKKKNWVFGRGRLAMSGNEKENIWKRMSETVEERRLGTHGEPLEGF